jgi:hypothetical protein
MTTAELIDRPSQLDYAAVPSEPDVIFAVAGLQSRGFQVRRVPDGQAAKSAALALLPEAQKYLP